jgi:urease alpha subunit
MNEAKGDKTEDGGAKLVPATAQRFDQAGVVAAQVSLRAGHTVLCAEQGALSLQNGLEINQPAAVSVIRQGGSVFCGGGGLQQ